MATQRRRDVLTDPVMMRNISALQFVAKHFPFRWVLCVADSGLALGCGELPDRCSSVALPIA